MKQYTSEIEDYKKKELDDGVSSILSTDPRPSEPQSLLRSATN
jgi:hypothetical protein